MVAGAERGRAGVSLVYLPLRVTHVASCPDIGPVCAERDEPEHRHDQRIHVSEARLFGEWAWLPWLASEVQVPIRLVRTTIIYRQLDGTAFEPPYADIHHRNETLAGPGDPTLAARLSAGLGAVHLSASLGLTLPLGRTEENPFALGRAGLTHQHIQLGTGTFDPTVGLQAEVPAGGWRLRAYGHARLSLYENARGYQAGNRFGAGLFADTPALGPVRLSPGVDVLNEQPERWDGAVEQDGNLGRTEALAGLSVGLGFDPYLAMIGARVPFYRKVLRGAHDDGSTLESPVVVNASVERRF